MNMALSLDWLAELLWALLRLLANPFYYIGILFVVLQYRREVALERRLLNSRLHSILGETWRTVLWGWAGGLAASVLMAFVGAAVTFEAIVWLWAIMFALVWLRIRYLCLAYAVGVIGVLKAVAAMLPEPAGGSLLQDVTASLRDIDLPPLLALVAILHLIEAALVRLQGTRMATPLFMAGKRGKIVGGYHLQGFWPVPLFLLVPAADSSLTLPWQPLMAGGDGFSALGWSLLAMPVIIGFTDRTQTMLPQRKMRLSSLRLLLYAPAVLLLAAAGYVWAEPVVWLLASALTIALHEALIWYGSREEEHGSPLYVHEARGLKVLAVLPGSPAAAMGIAAGEIISKVNGVAVASKEEMHQAMRANAAFCKLEVINLDGHSKFVSSAVFADKHHQLGILLCPDDGAVYYVTEKQHGVRLPALLARRWFGLRRSGNVGGEAPGADS